MLTSWTDQVFRYCERATDPRFWAEPFNALSNAAFLAVAIWALLAYHAPRRATIAGAPAAPRDPFLLLLIWLTFAIGIGSFLFHTFATRWSRLADVTPIGLFMIAYLIFALRRFLGATVLHVALAVGVFLAASAVAATISCPTQLTGIAAFSREPCLKGTMGYAPALAALLLVGALLHRRHPAGGALLAAAGLFLTAMLLRWLDARSCNLIVILGRPRGTHALWHLVNAATLYVLLRAALATMRAPLVR